MSCAYCAPKSTTRTVSKSSEGFTSGSLPGQTARMDALARQRAAVVNAWRADVVTRPDGGWAQLRDVAVHTTGIPVVHWNGAHVTGPDPDLAAAAEWFAAFGMPWAVLVPAESTDEP